MLKAFFIPKMVNYLSKFKAKPVKHLKLIEAMGLLLILVSWGLQWNNYNKYATEISSFLGCVRERQEIFIALQERANLNFQSAMTRTVVKARYNFNNTINHEDYDNKMWESEEVKQAWIHKMITNIIGFNNYLNFYEGVIEKNRLSRDGTIHKLKDELDAMKKPFKKVGIIDLNRLYALPKTFSAAEAAQAEKLFDPIFQDTMSVDNEIVSELNKRKLKWSSCYQIMYLFGSLFIILPKIFEWKVGLKEKKHTTLVIMKEKKRRR